jgi:hypothetical protein
MVSELEVALRLAEKDKETLTNRINALPLHRDDYIANLEKENATLKDQRKRILPDII